MSIADRISPLAIALVSLILLPTITSSSPLECHCNECEFDFCTTSDHNASRCFKSVERYIENNTYVPLRRYGCLSGSDDSLSTLQCNVNGLRHKEPIYIACCREDHCNLDLPDPTSSDDPRWSVSEPPEDATTRDTNQSHMGLVITITIFLTLMAICFCLLSYKLAVILFENYREKKKCSIDSQDSVCSFKIDFEEHLKNQYINHHQHSNSSTASTHTYSVSDFLPPKPDSPQENTCASIENSSTLPDLTSGVGTRVLEPRTMARVVDSGKCVFVGSGKFGQVVKGTYHCEDVAVKKFRSIDCESWRREEKILKQLNHENIVRFIASETYSVSGHITETWMFLEFCPYGSLCDFLDKFEICEPQAIKILYSIIKGLSYLHEDYNRGYKPPIAHRDIKSRNILMRTPEICCIADFGHAVVKINESKIDFGGCERIQVGTVRYMAPEILKISSNLDISSFHTFAQADLYQFGLVLWEVCYRTQVDNSYQTAHRLPYDGVVPHNPELEDMIKIVCEDNYRPPRIPHWDYKPRMQQLSNLMVECWRPNPKSRMETLGVKKKLKELYDRVIHDQENNNDNLIRNFSKSPHLGTFKDRPRSTDQTI